MILRALFSICALILSLSVHGAVDLTGVWMLSGPGTESEILLTEEGLRIQGEYDLLADDPSLYCVPASVARIWANPTALIKIEQTEDHLLISYELFDLRRDIPIGDVSVMPGLPSTKNLQGTYFQEMGSSFAHHEGDRLIIESRNHASGYIRTSRGIPQSENTITLEELRVEEGMLHIRHTYMDDILFEKPLVLEYSFRLTDATDVLPYECTESNYDWFNELNAKNDGELQ
ncbi:MAG: hypothetical protein COA96_03055 [SAR86 cluster bacterium]|uniref:Uncharacterized protein n=1 Tax=SAR86 cluster bacterium TaxID=2030880 RepID=A0A2A5B7L1_9GAMM|nr:MAG: hypothetical protein COA96_03055 [SAR86 cluster bacterium]